MLNISNKKMAQKAKRLNATFHQALEGKSPFMEYDYPNAFGRVVVQDGDTVTDIKNRIDYVPSEYTRWHKQCGKYDKRHLKN